MGIVDASMVTTAVVATLRDVLGIPVGDGAIPTPETEGILSRARGYAIVDRIPSGGRYEGSSLGYQRESMQWIRFQITGCGIQRDQAEAIAVDAISVLISSSSDGPIHPITIPGHAVLLRRGAGEIPTEQIGTVQAGGYVDLLVAATS